MDPEYQIPSIFCQISVTSGFLYMPGGSADCGCKYCSSLMVRIGSLVLCRCFVP